MLPSNDLWHPHHWVYVPTKVDLHTKVWSSITMYFFSYVYIRKLHARTNTLTPFRRCLLLAARYQNHKEQLNFLCQMNTSRKCAVSKSRKWFGQNKTFATYFRLQQAYHLNLNIWNSLHIFFKFFFFTVLRKYYHWIMKTWEWSMPLFSCSSPYVVWYHPL